MSINQELRTLADMYHSNTVSSTSLLDQLGKRVPVFVNQSPNTLPEMYRSAFGDASGLIDRLGKRIPHISINQVSIRSNMKLAIYNYINFRIPNGA